VAGILAFNLGIETMQLMVVAAVMPVLILMSRTRAYPIFRVGGALAAGVASVGWIAERLFHMPNLAGMAANSVAHYAIWIVSHR
jgi:hypothetical protein